MIFSAAFCNQINISQLSNEKQFRTHKVCLFIKRTSVVNQEYGYLVQDILKQTIDYNDLMGSGTQIY